MNNVVIIVGIGLILFIIFILTVLGGKAGD